MSYELEDEFELEMELDAAFGPDLEWEDAAQWESSNGCPTEARLKLSPETPKPLTLGKVQWLATCGAGFPTRADAFSILSKVVANAVRMLDVTIGELSRARQAACGGDVMVGPSDLTRCWLKYRLGVCIDDRAAWTQTSDKSGTVAEVIRRLVQPRNLIASNRITYACDPGCNPGANARTFVLNAAGACLQNPEEVIHLCAPFWTPAHAAFREQTLIHEAGHLTHCDLEESQAGVSIGSPWCLSMFVVDANGEPLNPAFINSCGRTPKCGPIPSTCVCCGKPKTATGTPVRPPARGRQPLPDWRP